jgi:hypothetical protein
MRRAPSPLQCTDARGRIVLPASEILRVGNGVSRPEPLEKPQGRLNWPPGTPPGIAIFEVVIDRKGGVCAVRFIKTPSSTLSEALAAAAAELFARYPGRWEVRERIGNEAARDFWRAAIGGFTGGRYEEEAIEDSRWHGWVQRLVA